MKSSSKVSTEPKQATDSLLIAQAQAKLNEGLALHRNGQLAQAQEIYQQVLTLQPRHFDALYMLSMIAGLIGNSTQALEWINKAIEVNPANASAYSNRGNALKDLSQYQAAIESYDKAIALKPDHADAHFNRALVLQDLKQHQLAVASYNRAITLRPDRALAYFNRGLALNELKQYQAAVDSYHKAITLRPGHAEAYYNCGNALGDLRLHQAAIDSYDRAIALKPDYVEAYDNRAIALCELSRYQAAIDSCDRAIALKPDCAEAYVNRGMALGKLKHYQAATDSFDQAIALKPDYAEAYGNRGMVLSELKQHQAAIDGFDAALAIKPDFEFLYGAKFHAKMSICDWSDMEKQIAELMQKVQRDEKASQPFSTLVLSTSLPLQRKAAEIYLNAKHPANSELGSIVKRAKRQKIRLGYFSMDFQNHPVAFLTAELFELHDRDRFEVYAYSFGPETKDEIRTRLEAAFDKFIDVKDKSDKEIANLARQMEIDIAIDLAGFTGDSRTGIFALRAAPIQVNYLGYPGTMGAEYMDYLIADKTLIPEESQQHYSEKIVYLPSFQVNDSKREISDKVFTRKELGLPESGFVFCCFNNNYKITPATFGGWMRILKRADQSVLFLYAENPLVITNLRREADLAGVDSDRLVFGTRLPVPEYLARYRSADLFLDTLPFNGGTTASNALWAGLPVLTCTGEAFSSRMAASLLNAIGLPELITSTKEEYEALAVELATDADKLKAIRQKLEENRLSKPLFDTKRFTRNIENAYTQMVQRYQADLAPEHIYVKENRQADTNTFP